MNAGTAIFQIVAILFLFVIFFVIIVGVIRKAENVRSPYTIPAIIVGLALFFGLSGISDSVRQSVNNVSQVVSSRPPSTSMPTSHLQVTTSDGLVWLFDQSANRVLVYRFNKEKGEIELVTSRDMP